jgi:hypothetical protein
MCGGARRDDQGMGPMSSFWVSGKRELQAGAMKPVQAVAPSLRAELAAIEALGNEDACRICEYPDVTEEPTPS